MLTAQLMDSRPKPDRLTSVAVGACFVSSTSSLQTCNAAFPRMDTVSRALVGTSCNPQANSRVRNNRSSHPKRLTSKFSSSTGAVRLNRNDPPTRSRSLRAATMKQYVKSRQFQSNNFNSLGRFTHRIVEISLQLREIIGIVGIPRFYWRVRQLRIVTVSQTIIRVRLVFRRS